MMLGSPSAEDIAIELLASELGYRNFKGIRHKGSSHMGFMTTCYMGDA